MARAGPLDPWPVRRRTGTLTLQEDSPLPSRSIRRVVVVTALAALALSIAGSAAGSRPAADRPPPIVIGFPPETTFYGRGWGHGVGMSQHGARGRALAGQAAAEILAHYFAGTTLGTKDPASPVRVLLLDGFAATAAKPLVAHGRGGSWTHRWDREDVPGRCAPDRRAGECRVDELEPAGRRRPAARALHASVGERRLHDPARRRASVLQLDSKPSSYDTYRGTLRVKLTTTARVINDRRARHLPPRRRPDGDAARAGRSRRSGPRRSRPARTRPTGCIPSDGSFDVYDDTRSQVYRGVEAEAAADERRDHGHGRRGAQERVVDRERDVPLDRRRRDREQRVRVRVGVRRDRVRRRCRTCAARRTGSRTGRRTTRAPRSRRGRPAGVQPRRARGDLQRRPAHRGRHVDPKLDLSRRGVSGRLISVTLTRLGRLEDGLRRRLPGGVQRQSAGRRAGDAQHARRHPTDPVSTDRPGT